MSDFQMKKAAYGILDNLLNGTPDVCLLRWNASGSYWWAANMVDEQTRIDATAKIMELGLNSWEEYLDMAGHDYELLLSGKEPVVDHSFFSDQLNYHMVGSEYVVLTNRWLGILRRIWKATGDFSWAKIMFQTIRERTNLEHTYHGTRDVIAYIAVCEAYGLTADIRQVFGEEE